MYLFARLTRTTPTEVKEELSCNHCAAVLRFPLSSALLKTISRSSSPNRIISILLGFDFCALRSSYDREGSNGIRFVISLTSFLGSLPPPLPFFFCLRTSSFNHIIKRSSNGNTPFLSFSVSFFDPRTMDTKAKISSCKLWGGFGVDSDSLCEQTPVFQSSRKTKGGRRRFED